MKIFYLIIILISLGFIYTSPELETKKEKGKLDLCNLREGQEGKITGLISKIKYDKQKQTTIVNSYNGCSAIVIDNLFPEELQTTVTFNTIVQGGFLKFPINISLENNIGNVIPYEKIETKIIEKPQKIENKNYYILSILEKNENCFPTIFTSCNLYGRKLHLKLPYDLEKKIAYNKINQITFDLNNNVININN